MTTAAANTVNEDDDDDSCQCQQAGRQQQLPAATNTDNNVNSCQCQCFLQSVPHPLPRSKCETEGYILFNFLQPVLIPFLARNTRWGGGFYILFYFIVVSIMSYILYYSQCKGDYRVGSGSEPKVEILRKSQLTSEDWQMGTFLSDKVLIYT